MNSTTKALVFGCLYGMLCATALIVSTGCTEKTKIDQATDGKVVMEPGEIFDPVNRVVYTNHPLLRLENGCEIRQVAVVQSVAGYKPSIYTTTCPISLAWSCGKSQCRNLSSPEIPLEEIAKLRALEKLTPEDRKALGITEEKQ